MSFNDEVMSESSRQTVEEAARRKEWIENHESRMEMEGQLSNWFSEVGMTPVPSVEYDIDFEDINTSDYSPSDLVARVHAKWWFEDHEYAAMYSQGRTWVRIFIQYKGAKEPRSVNTRREIGDALLAEHPYKAS